MSSEAVDVRSCDVTRCLFPLLSGIIRAQTYPRRKENVEMSKTSDLIAEIIRNPKPTFRKADDRPVKAQKHRYERRKIKEFIKLGDWVQENPV